MEEVFFIVSKQTASTGELLINSLIPYIKTTVIGVHNTTDVNYLVSTFGKPMGSIGISIGPFEIYYAMFQNLNAADEGDYFTGIAADQSTIDQIEKDFGDIDDPAILLCLTEKRANNIQAPEEKKNYLRRDVYLEFDPIPLLIKNQ